VSSEIAAGGDVLERQNHGHLPSKGAAQFHRLAGT
jgi:hypothetical protein